MKTRHIAVCLLAVSLTAGWVGDSRAQEGSRRGGDRSEFRGRGFGGGGDPTIRLLMNEQVREEIDLMPDQVEALKKVREDVGPRGERPDFDFRNASEEARAEFFQRMRAEHRERSEKIREQLEEILLPAQLSRLEQLSIQVQGIAALNNPEVKDRLKISDSQKQEFET
ncbi:MAG: hypothetical protein ACF788_10870, partial [Novipirellula sp. JB048]